MTSLSFASFLPAGPEAILALASMALLLLGVFKGDRAFRLVSWLAVAVFIIIGVLVATGIGNGAMTGLNGSFIADGFGRFIKLIILGGGALTLLLSLTYAEREETARFEYPVLFLFASLGMMMMVSANDLLSLYLALELQNLGLYILAAVRRDSVKSTEAGLKYFVLSALSSGLLLYGISLVYGFAGTISFSALAQVFTGGASVGAIIGLSFVAAGLAFKISAVPFHMWTPDVYEGAPTPVTAFFSVAPKAAALGLLVRVMTGPFGPLTDRWQEIVGFISVASMVLGAFAAIYQTNIKRLMAYSSISNIGYMLIGLAAGTEAGVRAIAIYLAIYLLMNVGTWGVILAMRSKGVMLEQIDDLKGLARTRPGLALAMAVFMFSLAGIPPLAGFFGKLYVFLAAIQAGEYTLAVIGVLASAVAAYYYLHIVKVMYFDEPMVTFDASAGEVSAVVLLSGLFVGFFFIWPQPVLAGAARAAHALFAG